MEFPLKTISVKQSVLATLAFFDIFKIPLNRSEISEYLLFLKPDEKNIDLYLKESLKIRNQNGYFSLGLNENDYLKKFANANDYWKKVGRFRFLFAICPFVKMAAICNSLAINDVEENSDIDLFIITEKNRLFAARFVLVCLSRILGIKRYGNKIKKRFCLSFFVSEDNRDFSQIALKPYDIYLAFWLQTLQPISGDYELYKSFMESNQKFLKNYFPHEIKYKKTHFRKDNCIQRTIKKILEFIFSNAKLNSKLEEWQLKRIEFKIHKLTEKSGTIINSKMLKFHDKDMREQIRNEWEKKLSQVI